MNRRPNLVLLGFMGTGKSVAGRKVAALLHFPFHDMDTELARRSGKSIPDIFAEEGESAFRDMESALAAEWSATLSGTIIATGGGVVLREENIAALAQNGILVGLTADPDLLVARLTASATGRPLLDEASSPAAALRHLWNLRAPLYARLPFHLDTSRLSPDQVAEQLAALYRRATAKMPAPGGIP